MKSLSKKSSLAASVLGPLAILLPVPGSAAPNTLVLEEYHFSGTFSEMTHLLHTQLVAQIQKTCGEGASVQFSDLSIRFALGQLSSGKGLVAEVIPEGKDSGLSFPHHPKATLKASFDCL